MVTRTGRLVSTNFSLSTVDCRQSNAPNVLNGSIITGRCVECMVLNSSLQMGQNLSTAYNCCVNAE